MKRRFLSLLLCAALLCGLVPGNFALAAGTDNKAIMQGTSGLKDPTAEGSTYYTPNSYIYFGVNGSTPIKWRVLDADKANDGSTAGAFLLSEYLLASGLIYDDSSNEYQGSDMQQWCKNFASNQSNFSQAEQGAMLGVPKTDEAEYSYSISWGESSLTADDKMFLLSVRELADYVGSYDSAPGLKATFSTAAPMGGGSAHLTQNKRSVGARSTPMVVCSPTTSRTLTGLLALLLI